MKYALLIYPGPETPTLEDLAPEEAAAVRAEYMAVVEEPDVIGGEGLQPVETATTVRVDGGQTLTTDGPFADTKEHVGGFFLVEADNIDRALELAARIPAARMGGAVEVRPVMERPR
jgi:hypothetical protein